MILYLAGSFPHLYNIKKERALMERIEKKHEYHRLTSFYYAKTCDTVLSLKGERMGIEPVMSEKGKGKTNQDFDNLKENTETRIKILVKKYDWIKDWRFIGNIAFKSGRRKTEMKKLADAGEEVSWGANILVTYINHKGKERKTCMIMRHKPKPYSHIDLQSWEKNPTMEDLKKQMKDTWIYLTSGGTVENPTAVALSKLGEYDERCLKPTPAKGKQHRFTLFFKKWIKFTLCGINIFGEDAEAVLLEKIRKEV